MTTALNIVAHIPFYAGGAFALWSLRADIIGFWRKYVW